MVKNTSVDSTTYKEMREPFLSYESVRRSGVTNMFARRLVCELAGITVDEYSFIIHNYDELSKMFLEG